MPQYYIIKYIIMYNYAIENLKFRFKKTIVSSYLSPPIYAGCIFCTSFQSSTLFRITNSINFRRQLAILIGRDCSNVGGELN